MLTIWFFADLVKFAKEHKVACLPIILQGPWALALDVIPDSLTAMALEQLDLVESYKWVNPATIERMRKLITENNRTYLFPQAMQDILLLDNIRHERLFDMLPFKQLALSTLHKFDEYK